MKKKKMLFVASLPSKKRHFDGERNKSGIVLKSVKTMNYDVFSIDYTKNKYWQTIKLLFAAVFGVFDVVFISKCAVGGSFALHLFLRFANKHNKSNVYFYLIGNGFKGFDDKKIYKDDFKYCKKMIVESQIVVEEMKKYGLKNCVVFPCVKDVPLINPILKDYDNNNPLRVIFFSRITNNKGLSDIIDAVKTINSNGTKYILDIAGGVSKEELDYVKKIISICSNDNNINYYGEGFCISGIDSYLKLQEYDLHAFPTHFFQECAPGSIIDMFIAGVPTISSKFENAMNVMNNDNSYFFEMENVDDLINKLVYIYSHKNELNKKRIASHNEANKYSIDSFVSFLENTFIN